MLNSKSQFAVLAAAFCACVGARGDVPVQALTSEISVVTDFGGAEAVQADGKLLLSGWASTVEVSSFFPLERIGADGQVDPTFDASSAQVREIDIITPLPNGQTLLSGRFGTDPNGVISASDDTPQLPDPDTIVRVNADGSVDASFQSPPLPFSWINSVNLLPDGGALVAGYVTGGTPDATTTSAYQLARITQSGALDASFQPGLPADASIDLIQVQPDGRILLVTESDTDDSGDVLTRLNSDGSVDGTFHSALAPGLDIDVLTLLPSGQLLVAGDADDDDADADTVTRLNADGSVDPSFSVALPGSASALLPLSGGAILAVGDFTDASGNDQSGIERIDSTGALIPVLDPALTDQLEDVALLPGGGFAVALSSPVAEDGARSGAVEIFDDSGALLSRTAVANSVQSLLIRPSGGLYVNTSTLTGIFEPLGGLIDTNTGFLPPPAPGVSIVKSGPTVTIKATRSAAYAGGIKKAKFLLSRDGDISAALKVTYKVKGTAVSGRDYQPLSGVKYFKAGRRTAKIKVRPMGPRYGRVRPGGAFVKLTLNERRAYLVGTTSSAKVRLLNHRGPKSNP